MTVTDPTQLFSSVGQWIFSQTAGSAFDGQVSKFQSGGDDFDPARVPYVFPTPGTNRVADEFRERRDGQLLALDGILLNSGLIAEAWNEMGGAIRDKISIPADMRELMILRVAVLNEAAYEWMQHEGPGRKAGLTTEQLLEIRMTPPYFSTLNRTSTLPATLYSAMMFTDYMTDNVHVPDSVYNMLKKFLNDKQMVEAAATVGFYNFVSRFLVTLNVDGKMNTPVPIPE